MIKEYFESFRVLTEEEIETIIPLFVPRKLKKFDFFVQEGERCAEIAFIESGVFRSYYLSGEGEEITYCFRFQNELMAAYSSFITGNGSLENMQALCPSELWVIKKSKLEEVAESPNWTKFLRIIAEKNYLELEQRVFQLQRENAQKRYETLLRNQPEYIQQIPLQYLSSYLGITQRHLSRIRKAISF